MPNKKIEAARKAIQDLRARMWDSFNEDRVIKRCGNAFDARHLRDDIAEAFAIAALEAAEAVNDKPTRNNMDKQIEAVAEVLFWQNEGYTAKFHELPYPKRRLFLKDAREVLEAAEAAEWLPIETAPKDGTKVLTGYWVLDEKGQPEFFQRVNWYSKKYKWLGNCDDTPTHWQPLRLPKPPKNAYRSNGG